MVHRWQCRHCDWTTWSASREQTAQEVKSHLVTHYTDGLSRSDFGVQWTCPHCDQEGNLNDTSEGIAQYRDHLFSHAESLMESGVHVAEDIGGSGSVLVQASREGPGATNARKHFLSPGDILLFVTARPKHRLRLVRDDLGEWPAWTVVMTSQADPLDGLSRGDQSLPVEVIQLDGATNLPKLGQRTSQVLDEYEQTDGKISFEFDILADLIRTFDLQQVFKFLHILTARLEEATALSHFHVDARDVPDSSLNVLEQVFDIRLTAKDRVFTSEPRVPPDE